MHLHLDSQVISTYLLSKNCRLRLPNEVELITTKYDKKKEHYGSHDSTQATQKTIPFPKPSNIERTLDLL
jgi:hypothetical protein